jgi:hypothetical protein
MTERDKPAMPAIHSCLAPASWPQREGPVTYLAYALQHKVPTVWCSSVLFLE